MIKITTLEQGIEVLNNNKGYTTLAGDHSIVTTDNGDKYMFTHKLHRDSIVGYEVQELTDEELQMNAVDILLSMVAKELEN